MIKKNFLKKLLDYKYYVKQLGILLLCFIGLITIKGFIDNLIDSKYDYLPDNAIYGYDDSINVSEIVTENQKLNEEAKLLSKSLNNELKYSEFIFSSSVYICDTQKRLVNVYYSSVIDIAYSIFNVDKINIDTDMNQSGIYISEALYNSLECPDELKLSVSGTSESISFPIAGIYKDENEETKMGRMYCSLSVFETLKEDYKKITITKLIVLNDEINYIKEYSILSNDYNFKSKFISQEKELFNTFYLIIKVFIITITIILSIEILWILYELNYRYNSFDKLNIILYSNKKKVILNEIVFLLGVGVLVAFICLIINIIFSLILYAILNTFLFKIEIYFLFLLIYCIVIILYAIFLKNISLKKVVLK